MYSIKSKQIRRSRFTLKSELKSDLQDIRKYQAIDIADELTLINQNLLLSIKPEELFNLVFLSPEKVKYKSFFTSTKIISYLFHIEKISTKFNINVRILR